jgi:hypothetical protein
LLVNSSKTIWLFNHLLINTSLEVGIFQIVAKYNVIVLLDPTFFYVDVFPHDLSVTCMVGLSAGTYIFYTISSNIGRIVFQPAHNVTLPGPVIMALVRDTAIFLYYKCGTDVVFSHVSLSSLGDSNWALSIFNNSSPLLFNTNNKTSDCVLYDIAWNEYLLQYVILATQNGVVSVWYSPTPFGPFTKYILQDEQLLYNITHTYFHTELWRNDGRIMAFTYYTNNDSFGGSLPHLAEIELLYHTHIKL